RRAPAFPGMARAGERADRVRGRGSARPVGDAGDGRARRVRDRGVALRAGAGHVPGTAPRLHPSSRHRVEPALPGTRGAGSDAGHHSAPPALDPVWSMGAAMSAISIQVLENDAESAARFEQVREAVGPDGAHDDAPARSAIRLLGWRGDEPVARLAYQVAPE